MSKLVEAILLGLLSGFAMWDGRVFGMWMLDRPLITGPLVGLILGDFKTGIIVGASVELVFMGIAGIGAATPPDVVSGGILATAFAIISGLDTGAAVALALPIATLGQIVGILDRTINGVFVHWADEAAEKGDYKGVEKALWAGAFLFFISYFVLVFFGYLLGSSVIQNFVAWLPDKVLHGFTVASGILPALGIAILMQLLINKKNAAYLLVGWIATALLGVETVGAAVIGLTIAYIAYQSAISKSNTSASSGNLGGEL
ncbi:PTS mannose/fructose/sorbose/N-acetylgalactosamine transporter subunit IIC [Tepidanaerobacter syntrophicus]|uniref:PTS mannose/fructose/sorbose/N-acetylgalactosamine transporter subunit IIC n=1 Tax=Tepidanaerobacter syntrophicus TaxID=224999 RepID=UPI001BD4F057|nr:PTS sugar transporter subunit IIC [Tepidanaerobacter syntrophicus]